MEKKHLIFLLAIFGLAFIGCKTTDKSAENDFKQNSVVEATKVGIYDSRVIAFAYWSQEVEGKQRLNHPDYNSNSSALAYWSEQVDGKPRYIPPDDKGLKGKEFGYMMHQQVFSYHEPVQALEYIADKLPEVMKQADVDVIISKWEKEKLAKFDSTKFVDITDRLVQLFNPTAQFLKKIGDSKKLPPPEPLDTNWLVAEE
jgi:hypothetical protein